MINIHVCMDIYSYYLFSAFKFYNDLYLIFVTIFRQLVVRHYKVYYPVRHHLIPHMVNSLQRLGFTSSVRPLYSLLLSNF